MQIGGIVHFGRGPKKGYRLRAWARASWGAAVLRPYISFGDQTCIARLGGADADFAGNGVDFDAAAAVAHAGA